MRIIILIIGCLVICSCGSGSGAGDSSVAATTESQTIYYPSGRVAETGAVKIGTTVRIGEWQSFFDQDGSPKKFTGVYKDGALDPLGQRREWNVDGSIRTDVSDR